MIDVACAGSGAKGMSLPRKKNIMAWNAIPGAVTKLVTADEAC